MMTFTLNQPSEFPRILAEIQPEMGRLNQEDYCPVHFEYEVQPTMDCISMVATIYLADGDCWDLFEIKFSKFLSEHQVLEIGDMFDGLDGLAGYFRYQRDGELAADINQFLLR